MSDDVLNPPNQPNRLSRLLHTLRNPVTLKELRSRMRGRRAFVVLTVYLAVMGGLLSLIYLAFLANSSNPTSEMQVVGKTLFSTIVGIQGFLVLFVGPAFTAGAISGERERQTYDLLRTTLLSAPAFVTGKLLSALSYVVLLILAAVPMQSVASLLGGVSLTEIIVSQLLLVVTAVAIALFGLYASARMKTTLGASVFTFAGVLMVTAGLPALTVLFLIILSPAFNALTSSPLLDALVLYTGLTVCSFNLPATLIVSDLLLLEEGILFVGPQTVAGTTIYVFSPWMSYLLVYALIAWLFYRLTIRRVRKVSNE